MAEFSNLQSFFNQEATCWNLASRWPLGNEYYKSMQVIHRESEKLRKMVNGDKVVEEQKISSALDLISRHIEYYLEKKELKAIEQTRLKKKKMKEELNNKKQKLDFIKQRGSLTEKQEMQLVDIELKLQQIQTGEYKFETLSKNETAKYNAMLALNNALSAIENVKIKLHEPRMTKNTKFTEEIKNLAESLSKLEVVENIKGWELSRVPLDIPIKKILGMDIRLKGELIFIINGVPLMGSQEKPLQVVNKERTYLVSEIDIKMQKEKNIIIKLLSKVGNCCIGPLKLRIFLGIKDFVGSAADEILSFENILDKGKKLNLDHIR